jgi:uncharacterized membrane protein YeaQ/YmgE (transglycosylase-associated protein family)
LLFPVLSALFTLIAVLLIVVPTFTVVYAGGDDRRLGSLVFLAMFVSGYCSTVVATFFNVALVSCAAEHFHGRPTSVGDGLRAAARRMGSILVWALIATAVGVIVRSVEQRAGLVGSIVAGLVGAAWSVATYFVVPVLAFEQVGPMDAVRRSVETVRRSWGESLIGNTGLGLAAFVLALPVLLIGFAGAKLVPTDRGAGISLLAVAGGLLVALIVVSSALGQVYKTAVYLYAANGEVAGYSQDLLDGAFRPKRG